MAPKRWAEAGTAGRQVRAAMDAVREKQRAKQVRAPSSARLDLRGSIRRMRSRR